MEHQRFSFTRNQKILFVLLILVGIAATIYGFMTADSHRLWANILLNSFYFLGIALSGVFFLAVHVVGQSGWHTSIQRIPEAMGSFLPIAAVFMAIIVAFGMHDIYHWTHTDHLDEVLEGKKGYLNIGFFIVRMLIYFAGWIFLSWKIRQLSIKSDQDPNLIYYKRIHIFSIIYIVFFAISNSTSSWDILMSIDPHWYSTLYAWYIFSSIFVSGVAVIILILIFIRSKGYMPHTNKEHLHDLGKYLFGFSVFWMYLWFSQYMLIYYGNIPEETTYYITRWEGFSTLMFVSLGLNFFAPFLGLLPRFAPRKSLMLVIASIIVIVGHWLDLYIAIMPGAAGEHTAIDFLEIGMTIGFAGLFLFVVFRSLTKASLVPLNHPFFKESLEYHNL